VPPGGRAEAGRGTLGAWLEPKETPYSKGGQGRGMFAGAPASTGTPLQGSRSRARSLRDWPPWRPPFRAALAVPERHARPALRARLTPGHGTPCARRLRCAPAPRARLTARSPSAARPVRARQRCAQRSAPPLALRRTALGSRQATARSTGRLRDGGLRWPPLPWKDGYLLSLNAAVITRDTLDGLAPQRDEQPAPSVSI
jgi:hypothetical protein